MIMIRTQAEHSCMSARPSQEALLAARCSLGTVDGWMGGREDGVWGDGWGSKVKGGARRPA